MEVSGWPGKGSNLRQNRGGKSAKDDGAGTAQRKPPLPAAEVRATPAETTKVRALPTCTTRRDGVIGPHARGSVGGAGGGRPGQHVEGWSNWASRTRKRGEARGGRSERRGEWAAKTVERPSQQPAQPPVRHLLGPGTAEMTPHRTPAAAAVKTQRPDATREGKNG